MPELFRLTARDALIPRINEVAVTISPCLVKSDLLSVVTHQHSGPCCFRQFAQKRTCENEASIKHMVGQGQPTSEWREGEGKREQENEPRRTQLSGPWRLL